MAKIIPHTTELQASIFNVIYVRINTIFATSENKKIEKLHRITLYLGAKIGLKELNKFFFTRKKN